MAKPKKAKEPAETLIITYRNGAKDELPFDSFSEARDYYQHKISYRPGTSVARVELRHADNPAEPRAIWDFRWDARSKAAGLM